MTIRSIFIALFAIITVVAGPAGASAGQWLATFNFTCLSGGQCNSGGDNLYLKITGAGYGYDIRFTFLNSWDKGNIDSIITGITFGSVDQEGNFQPIDNPASPNILDYSKSAISRGTDDVDFAPVDKDYATDFTSPTTDYTSLTYDPTTDKGLNLGESVSVKYAVTDPGDDEFELLSDLVSAIGDSSLSIQLNVQMIGTRTGNISSGTFLLNSIGAGPVPIPEPATMLLLGTGLVGIAAVTRKRFNIT